MTTFLRHLRKWWAEKNSCSKVLARYAVRHPAIESLRFDHRKNILEMAFTQDLPGDEASAIARRITGELALREPNCALREWNRVCDDCTGVGTRARVRPRMTRTGLDSAYDGVALTLTRSASAPRPMARIVRKVQLDRGRIPWVRSRSFWEPVFSAVTLVSLLAGALAARPSGLALDALYIAGYLAGGFFGVADAFATLRRKRLDVNFLMIAAALGAATIRQPREGLILLFLFSLSNTLQGFALSRSRRAIRGLMELKPETAALVTNGATEEVLTELLRVGDVVRVRPGERMPVDGIVVRGGSEVDQAPITGESVPVWKERGAAVYAGTMNGAGALEIEVTAPSERTLLNRIMELVEAAQSHKAKAQVFLESFEQKYAAGVVAASAIAALLLPVLGGWRWGDAFYRAMTLLVVASPCALVISTPATLLSAIANAARRGVLFKGGEPMERLAEVRAVALDKTGTLTEAKLKVTRVQPIGCSETDLWQLLLDVESLSEHSLATAIVREAASRGLKPRSVERFEAQAGRGVLALRNARTVRIGTPAFVADAAGIHLPESLRATVDEWQKSGESVLVASEETDIRGIVGVADELRPGAAEAIARLRTTGIARMAMLTGDSRRVADALGHRLGVDETYAELLPEAKLKVLAELTEKYGPVAMVGDGVNDAPALAAARIGIAMGAGSDVALETADVALVGNDLARLPFAIALARQAMTVLKQNIAFSAAVIIVLVLATFFGDLRLPLGVVGHEGSTLIVVLNGLRLLVYREGR
jgi:Cd2+/Zn2+-exporting ATPase